jgi:hypothetical protein
MRVLKLVFSFIRTLILLYNSCQFVRHKPEKHRKLSQKIYHENTQTYPTVSHRTTLSGMMGPVKSNSRKRETERVRKAGCWKGGTQNCAAGWDLIKRADVWFSYGNSSRTMRINETEGIQRSWWTQTDTLQGNCHKKCKVSVRRKVASSGYDNSIRTLPRDLFTSSSVT